MSTREEKIQLATAVDSSGALKGLKEVEGGAARMAGAVADSAGKAGARIDAMGDSGTQASTKLEGATRSIAASIQRATAAAEAGEKGTAKFFESLARQRGADLDYLRPLLNDLDKVQQRTNGLTISMGQYTNALRMVPAQMTDVVTSLASGQDPLLVLIQQGGQLKDQFGGVGAATKAIGGYVLGLVNPVSAAVAAAGGLALAFEAGRRESAGMSNALIQTGNVAGTTVGQLHSVARAVDAVAGTQGRAVEMLTQLVQGGVSGRAALEDMTVAAIQFERAGGQAAEETVKQFIELGKDPVKAVLKLNEGMNFLTAATYEQIQSMAEQGRTAAAARVAQTALADALKDRSAGMVENLGLVEKGWRGIKDAVSEAWDAIKSIGRSIGPEGQLAAAKTSADYLQQQIDSRRGRGLATGDLERQLAAANELIQARQEEVRLIARAAAAEGERARIQREGVAAVDAVVKVQEKGLSKQQQLTKALDDYREGLNKIRASNPESALLKPEAVASGEKAIREQFKETAAARISAEDSQMAALRAKLALEDEALRRLQAYGLQAEKFTEGEREVLRLQEQLAVATGAKAKAAIQAQLAVARELATRQAATATIRESLKWEEELGKRRLQAYNDAVRADEAAAAQRDKAVQAVQQQVQRLEDEEKAALLAAASNVSLAQAVEMVGLARVKEAQAKALAEGADGATLLALQREIEARERLIVLVGNKEARDASAKAAKEAQTEWERAALEIERTLTDSLMRGFESGKGFAQNLRDTVLNMFKTMVLRPIVQGIVQGGLSAVGLGAAGMASAGTSAAGSLGGSAASSLLFGGASMSAIGSSIGTGFMATISGQSVGAAAGAYSAAGMGGVSAGLQIGAALPYIGAVLVALNGLGVFRTTKTVGAGLTGTLGAGDIEGYDLRRKSGTLFGGPDYSTRSTGVSPLSSAIQRDYVALRSGVMDMAEALGIGATRIANYTTALGAGGTVGGGLSGVGLNLNDEYKALQAGKINEAQYAEAVQKKINAALESASNEMAEQLIGTWNSTTEDITRTITETGAGGYEDTITRKVTEQVAKSTYVASQYARENERAIDTLKRLSGSLQVTNGAFDILGVKAYEASLAGGNMASVLVDLFGGVEGFQRATSSYFEQFYSDTEKFATQQRLLRQGFDELGLAVPRSTRDFRALVEAQDLTTESGRETYAQLMALAPAFKEVSGAVEAAFDSISRTTASSVRDIEMSLLDSAGKYDYLDREIETLITQLSTATLPGDIESLFKQINANTVEAYGLLDPSKQKSMAAEFIDALYEAEAIAQSRLSVAGDQASTFERQVQAVQVSMEAAQLQREAATAMIDAANEMRLAAQRMQEAANTPVVLQSSNGTVVGGREVMVA